MDDSLAHWVFNLKKMTLLSDKNKELEFIRNQLHELEEVITTQSLKILVVSSLELYLSLALVLSLFECVDPTLRDRQELKYMSRMAWAPFIWGVILAFGHRVLPSITPSPENLDRNLRISKLVTYFCALAFLIWDTRMELKQGPALQVAALFCVCDIARYEMEVARLIEDEDEDEEADRELERLASALDTATHADEQENAFKNQIQAVAQQSHHNVHSSQYHQDDRGSIHGTHVDSANVAAGAMDGNNAYHHHHHHHHTAMMQGSPEDSSYREYSGATPPPPPPQRQSQSQPRYSKGQRNRGV